MYKRQGVSTYTSAFALAGTCVSGKQSLGPLLCDHSMLNPHGTSQQWLPLSRSSGYILPSSLTRVLPRTFGFSPRIPVSVSYTHLDVYKRQVQTQAEIIQLLLKLQAETKMSLLFISHDITLVQEICQRILIMQSGTIDVYKRQFVSSSTSSAHPSVLAIRSSSFMLIRA